MKHSSFFLSLLLGVVMSLSTFSLSTLAAESSRSALSKIEAESWFYEQGTKSFPSVAGGVVVGHLDKGDWMEYHALDFGTAGANSITIRYGVPGSFAGKVLSIRTGSSTGKEIGRITLEATSNISPFAKPHWEIYKEINFPLLSTVTGVQDVFFVFEGDSSANMDWFRFDTSTKTSASKNNTNTTSASENTTPRSVRVEASSNPTAKPGDTVYMSFTFYANTLSQNYNLAVHFDNPTTGFRLQNVDIQSSEMSSPTKLWKGKTTLQYSYKIPENTPSGTYDINVGFFTNQGGKLSGVPIYGDSVIPMAPAVSSFDGKVKVGTLTISTSATSQTTSSSQNGTSVVVKDTIGGATNNQGSTSNTNGGYTTTSNSVGSTAGTTVTSGGTTNNVKPLVTMAITPGLEGYAEYGKVLNTLIDLELKVLSLKLQLQNFNGSTTPFVVNATSTPNTNGGATTSVKSPAITNSTTTISATPVIKNVDIAFTPIEKGGVTNNIANQGSISSVQEAIDDMRLSNSYPIAVVGSNGQIVEKSPGGYPARHGAIAMGNLAHGSSAPGFWSPSGGYERIRNENWPRLVPWVVLLTGVGNQASNTRVEFRNIQAYVLRKSTGQWEQVSSPASVDGYNCPPGSWDNCGESTDIYSSNGITSLKPSRTGSNFHGWSTAGGRVENPYGVDIYYSTVEARLVGSDTNSAQYMLHIGSDFYPDGIQVGQMSGYNPGSGYSRTKAITTEWNSFNYATIDVGQPDGDSNGETYIHNRAYIASEQTFRNNPPPPLRGGTTSSTTTTKSTVAQKSTTPTIRDAFTAWYATEYSDMSGIQVEGDHIGYTAAGDWVKYSGVNFGSTTANTLALEIALPTNLEGVIQLRLDSPTGTILRSFTPTPTGSWTTFVSQAVDIQPIQGGVHDVYLTFSGPSDVANIRGIVFSDRVVTYTPPVKTTNTATQSVTANTSLLNTSGRTRILALGDSMTAGSDAFRAYRARLTDLLISRNVEFVGTLQSGDASWYSAWGGAFIGPGDDANNNIYDRLPSIFDTLATNGRSPDIIIASLGWNSVYNEPDAAGWKYEGLIKRLQELAPNAKIITATLSPQRGETESQSNNSLSSYRALNDVARRLANASSTDNIYLADLAVGGFVYNDYWDVIHWLQPGADKAAQIIYDTIVGGGGSTTTTTPTKTTTTTKTTSTVLTKSVSTGVTSNNTSAIQDAIDDMKEPPTGYGRGGYGAPQNYSSVRFTGNFEQALALDRYYKPSENYIQNANNLTSWCWLYQDQDNTAQNVAVEVRNHEIYILRKSTNRWELVDGGRPSGFRGDRNSARDDVSIAYNNQDIVDNVTVRVYPGHEPRTDMISHELWTPNAGGTRTDMYDTKAVYATCEARVVPVNGNDGSNLDSAKYSGEVGFDYWHRGGPGFIRNVGFWDGSTGRMERITRDWKRLNFIGIKIPDKRNSTFDSAYSGQDGWAQVEDFLIEPPYSLTEDEIWSNPPPPLR